MKIKTNELTGAALDWAVEWSQSLNDLLASKGAKSTYNPSTDWAQGGPIIEREVLDVFRNYSEGCWQAEANRYGGCPMGRGPTPLIAAMRCYVASKLGDTVDIPEELA